MDPLLIEKAADIIMNSHHAIALTGAGISTESGIPDFRSPGGIWERYDPMIFFFDRFISHPESVWRSFIEMFTAGDLPCGMQNLTADMKLYRFWNMQALSRQ